MQTIRARIAYRSEASVNARRKRAAPEGAAFFCGTSSEANPNTAAPVAVALVLTLEIGLIPNPLTELSRHATAVLVASK